MIGYVVLLGFALFIVGLFTHIVWTGRIKFGSRTLLNRRENPLGFWVVWALFAGFTVHVYVHFALTVSAFPGGPLAK